MKRTMRTHTRKSKRIGALLAAYEHEGVGGVVPNHAPNIRRFMLARGTEGWHVHLEVSTLRTWNGYVTCGVRVSINPSRQRRQALQAAWDTGAQQSETRV